VNWVDAAGFLAPIAVNIMMFMAGWNFHKAKIRRRQQEMFPYRWVCPVTGCTFVYASNDMILTDNAASEHVGLHAEGRLP
jgi:hypothetical protein